ncbi:MAG: hypothetical protein LCI00_19180 [Chloroflexi bacterium]|nr:hypothetical protein [Chloroflexota bacterium]MCC6894154.1 hypothetical protein [Anaerolineae bacterium]
MFDYRVYLLRRQNGRVCGGSQAGRGRISLDCPMPLGDYILLAGTPEMIAACGGILHYNKGTISLTTTTDDSLSPQTLVTQITLTQVQQKHRPRGGVTPRCGKMPKRMRMCGKAACSG